MNRREGGPGPASWNGAEVFELEVAGEQLMVLSMPAEVELPAELSAAEQEVAEAVLRGMTNAEIARRRGTAPRTVANQLASIYRKLGIASRSELAAHVVGSRRGKLR